MGIRAARIAGNSPPIKPIVTAQRIALTKSAGVTANANAIFRQLAKEYAEASDPAAKSEKFKGMLDSFVVFHQRFE